MESSNFLRKKIQEAQGKHFKTFSELAEKAGVNQGNLSSFMKEKGDPGRRENITFDTAWKILCFFGFDFSEQDAQRSPQNINCQNCKLLETKVSRLEGAVDALERQIDKHYPPQPAQKQAGCEKEPKYLPLGNGTEG